MPVYGGIPQNFENLQLIISKYFKNWCYSYLKAPFISFSISKRACLCTVECYISQFISLSVYQLVWLLSILITTGHFKSYMCIYYIRSHGKTWSWSPLICVEKAPTQGEWINGITWNHVYFNISVHFIVDTMLILK